jgi:membrane-bound lytic murein transglycosylase F
MLSQKRYYKTLKYGYARGSEPVRYVDSIYDYRDILQNINEEDKEKKSKDKEEEKKKK